MKTTDIYKTIVLTGALVWTLLSFLISCGTATSGASSPSTPAQVPISSEDFATMEIGAVATGAGADISAPIEKNVDEDISKAVVGTCPATSDDPAWVCINPQKYIVGIVKMEIGACIDSQGSDTTCTFSLNSHQNVVVTNSDGSAPTWTTVWDASTTTTTVIGTGTVREYSLELSSGSASLPGAENVTAFRSYSAFRFKVGYVAYGMPESSVLGTLSRANIETCTAPGGCVFGSSLISDGQRGDVIKTDSSNYYWYDETLNSWVASRPSNPKTQSAYVEGTENYDSYLYDSNGILTAYLKIDNNSDGTADPVTIAAGQTCTLTLTANIASTWQFKDSTDNDTYDDNEDTSDNAPTLGLTMSCAD